MHIVRHCSSFLNTSCVPNVAEMTARHIPPPSCCRNALIYMLSWVQLAMTFTWYTSICWTAIWISKQICNTALLDQLHALIKQHGVWIFLLFFLLWWVSQVRWFPNKCVPESNICLGEPAFSRRRTHKMVSRCTIDEGVNHCCDAWKPRKYEPDWCPVGTKKWKGLGKRRNSSALRQAACNCC